MVGGVVLDNSWSDLVLLAESGVVTGSGCYHWCRWRLGRSVVETVDGGSRKAW